MKGDIIPNGEFLYKYVNPKSFPADQIEIPHGIFIDREMSCDWEKIQKHPEKSYHIKEGKNIIIQITVCEEIKMPCNPLQPRHKQPAWEQEVIHDPVDKGEDINHPLVENQSHSLIKGLKKPHITKTIASNSKFYKIVTDFEDEIIIPEKVEKNPTKVRMDLVIILVLLLILLLILIAKM